MFVMKDELVVNILRVITCVGVTHQRQNSLDKQRTVSVTERGFILVY